MKIFTIIVIFLIYCAISFLLSYAFDEAKLWKNKKEPTLYQPSFEDLQKPQFSKSEFSSIIYHYEKYTKDIICPSYCYFKLLDEIKHYQLEENETGDILSTFFLQLFFVILLASTLHKFYSIAFFLCFLIALASCFLGSTIFKFIYSKTPLTIEHFYYDTDKLVNDAKENFKIFQENKILKFDISEEVYINNYIIDTHNEYLCFIRKTVFSRYHTRKILNKAGTLIYLLFFFTAPKL